MMHVCVWGVGVLDLLTHISCWVHQVVVLSATFTNQPWERPEIKKKEDN